MSETIAYRSRASLTIQTGRTLWPRSIAGAVRLLRDLATPRIFDEPDWFSPAHTKRAAGARSLRCMNRGEARHQPAFKGIRARKAWARHG
jgi:hypothetical protein